ncbi:MAG: CapA family protein [Saprospiraceae bacterium]
MPESIPTRATPVNPWSRRGKLLTVLLRFLYGLVRMFDGKRWSELWPEHHEDPLTMKPAERLYLGYKYYYQPVWQSEAGSDLERYFADKQDEICLPPGFRAETEITLSAGGDLMPYDAIRPEVCAALWDEAGDFFFDADIVTANLETPLDLSRPPASVPEVMLYHMYFNASEQMFEVFSGLGRYRGFDLLSVANNHALDMGEAGLMGTLDFLDRRQIAWCGAARTEAERLRIPIIERKGIRVAFAGATFSLNAETLPPDKPWLLECHPLNLPNPDWSVLVAQCQLARERGADLIVAHLHMGCAYQAYPSMHTLRNIREFCSLSGADVILANHPHNPQPFELLRMADPFSGKSKDVFVSYSQGDFVAYDIFSWCHAPLLYRLRFSKGAEGTFLSGIEARVYYTEAETRGGRIVQLRFRDASALLANPEAARSLSAFSQKEWPYVRFFLKNRLLPGNLSRLLAPA